MVIDVPVPQANDILGALYQLYQHVESHGQLLAPRCPARAHSNRCADDVLRLSAYTVEVTAHSPPWGSVKWCQLT